MSEEAGNRKVFERGGDALGAKYARRVLTVLRSLDVEVDFSQGKESVKLRQLKAEMYALIAYFLERSFPHLEKWVADHPSTLPVQIKDETYETPDGFSTVSYEELCVSLKDADENLDPEHTPEKIFHKTLQDAVATLMQYAVFTQLSTEIVREGDEEVSEDELVHIDEHNVTEDMIIAAHFHELFDEATYQDRDVTFQDFVLEGAGTAAKVMSSLALVAPMLSQALFGDTSPTNIAKCRAGLYGMIIDFTKLHIDEFNYLKAKNNMPDPHTLDGIMDLVSADVADDGTVICSLRADMVEIIDNLEYEAPEAQVASRTDTIKCPAMYALSSDGVVNKYLWKLASDISARTFDQSVELDVFVRRHMVVDQS